MNQTRPPHAHAGQARQAGQAGQAGPEVDGSRGLLVAPGAADAISYVVTDLELDGPTPGVNSMRSLASVAVTVDNAARPAPVARTLGEFSCNLQPLPGTQPHPDTAAWFATVPEVWEAATIDPVTPSEAITAWLAWVASLPAPRVFASAPPSLDGLWVDTYLRRFTDQTLFPGPHQRDQMFTGPGMCLTTGAAVALRRQVATITSDTLPPDWLGNFPHSHVALEDARGYAHLLAHLLT